MVIYSLLTHSKRFLGSKNLVNDTKHDMSRISSFRDILGAYITPELKMTLKIVLASFSKNELKGRNVDSFVFPIKVSKTKFKNIPF